MSRDTLVAHIDVVSTATSRHILVMDMTPKTDAKLNNKHGYGKTHKKAIVI